MERPHQEPTRHLVLHAATSQKKERQKHAGLCLRNPICKCMRCAPAPSQTCKHAYAGVWRCGPITETDVGKKKGTSSEETERCQERLTLVAHPRHVCKKMERFAVATLLAINTVLVHMAFDTTPSLCIPSDAHKLTQQMMFGKLRAPTSRL